MKRIFLLLSIFLFARTIHAQSSSNTWIDVTAAPYGVSNSCASDAGVKINLAIAAVPAQGGVVFFPAGCYLISTQLLDSNYSAKAITYLGYGRVEFRAYTATPPSNSIMQFGKDDTNVIQRRKIVNIYFNCNTDTINGVMHPAETRLPNSV